jgi:hypothetical protein
LRQIDQARRDLYGISEDLVVIQAQLALLPTREEVARADAAYALKERSGVSSTKPHAASRLS